MIAPLSSDRTSRKQPGIGFAGCRSVKEGSSPSWYPPPETRSGPDQRFLSAFISWTHTPSPVPQHRVCWLPATAVIALGKLSAWLLCLGCSLDKTRSAGGKSQEKKKKNPLSLSTRSLHSSSPKIKPNGRRRNSLRRVQNQGEQSLQSGGWRKGLSAPQHKPGENVN